jgi:hypothetical protein
MTQTMYTHVNKRILKSIFWSETAHPLLADWQMKLHETKKLLHSSY